MSTEKGNLQYESNENLISFGQYGHRFLDTAETSVSGEVFAVVEADEDGTSINYTSNADHGDSGNTGYAMYAGKRLYGKITDITVVSGSVTCYIKEW